MIKPDIDDPEYLALVKQASDTLSTLINALSRLGLHKREWTMLLLIAVDQLDHEESDEVKEAIIRALACSLFPGVVHLVHVVDASGGTLH